MVAHILNSKENSLSRHMKQFLVSLLLISSAALAYEIQCEYKTKTNWYAIDNVYFCDLASDVSLSKCDYMTDVDSEVTAVTGNHLDGKSNADVVGFRADRRKLNFFPRGLEKFFPADKIVFINVWATGLKEIHGKDLAPFVNVKFLSLLDNELVVLEPDLFKFNTQLEIIGLARNRIQTVDDDVFDQLNKLVSLYMDHNVCISSQVTRSRRRVLNLIEQIKRKC